MALPATWMRKNMLQTPVPNNSHEERQISENEMRVIRSIQKLSIPEWYLNNNSRPPKILRNNTPIDRRPPSWKGISPKKTYSCSTPLMPLKCVTVNRNGLLETEIGSSIGTNPNYETYKINRVSPTIIPPSPPKSDSPSKNCVAEKTTPRAKIKIVSGTFPRTSPSRKIQNINIVFPQQSKTTSELTTDLDKPDPPLDMTKDSLEVTNVTEKNEESHETTNYQDASVDSSSTERNMFRSPSRRFGYIKPWKPSTTQEKISFGAVPKDKLPVAESFKLRASSTPQGSPVSILSTSDFGVESVRQNRRSPRKSTFSPPTSKSACTCGNKNGRSPPIPLYPITDLDEPSDTEANRPALYSIPEAIEESKLEPPISPPPNKIEVIKKEKVGDLSKMGPFNGKRTLFPRESMDFRPRNLLPSNLPKASCSSPPSCVPIANEEDTSRIGLFETSRKSTELQKIVKSMQRSREGQSLVREIIQELNEKCKASPPRSTYVSPKSTNFVKSFVRDLENGIRPVPRDDEEEEERSHDHLENYRETQDNICTDEDAFISSENGSEDGVNSVAVSTSISYSTGSSSSDRGFDSPTINREDGIYDYNMNVDRNAYSRINNNNNNNSDEIEMPPMVSSDEDKEVYWVSISRCGLPRSSSLLSLASRWCSRYKKCESPSVSPIDPPQDSTKRNSYRPLRGPTTMRIPWNFSSKTKRAAPKKLRRIDETPVLDSGYSDRSSGRSSRLSYWYNNAIWSDYGESTPAASEIGSCHNEPIRASNSTDRTSSRAEVYGPPVII